MKLLLTAVLLSAPLLQSGDVRPGLDEYNVGKSRLALEGYDPVGYFDVGGGKPIKGKKSITETHEGVVYRFASKANRDLFVGSPDRFEPAYGGWCAYAMASGDKTDIDPKTYLIEDGRLLVFYKGLFGNTRKSWIKEDGGEKLRGKADQSWTKFSGEAAERPLTHFNLEQGLALGGFDPVAVAAGEPVLGKASIATVHEGVTFHFANEANAAKFNEQPAAHDPAFGGWCATGMAGGQKIEVDPAQFLNEDGRLLLFSSAAARQAWIDSNGSMAPRAESAWTGLHAKG